MDSEQQKIFIDHFYLIKYVIDKMRIRHSSRFSYADAQSVGKIALARACMKHDKNKTNSFKSFAILYIRGALIEEMCRTSNASNLSRTIRFHIIKIKKLNAKATATLGRNLTTKELAKEMGVSQNVVRSAKLLWGADFSVSIDDHPKDYNHHLSWSEVLCDPTEDDPAALLVGKDMMKHIHYLLDKLSSKDKTLLDLRYKNGLDVQDIADQFGVSDNTMHARYKFILDRIKRALSHNLKMSIN